MAVTEIDAATIRAVMEFHRPDELGGFHFCLGCLDVWGKGVSWPCTQVLWVRPQTTAAEAESWVREEE